MRILQLCGRVPFPPVDGGRVAMASMARSLVAAGHSVRILALNTSRQHVRVEEIRGRTFGIPVEAVDIDTSIRPLDALVSLVSGDSYHVARFRSRHVAERLRAVLRPEGGGGTSARDPFDIVQLESLYLTPYVREIRALTSAPIVLRALNVEFEIWERLARRRPMGPTRLYLSSLARRLRAYEAAALAPCDAVVAISRRDAEVLSTVGGPVPMHVTPCGLFPEEYPAAGPGEPLSVCHIGSMDWLPNQEAVRFLLDEIWPLVLARCPGAVLHLAGRGFPRAIRRRSEAIGARLHEDVPDARAFLARYRAVAVPVLSGSGMRVKVLEALALGKPVVATPVGAEGFDVTSGEELLVASDAETFAAGLVRCLEDDALAARLSRAGREHVARRYDGRDLARELTGFYEGLARRR